MLTAILASAVLSAQAVEPIDFHLDYKVGDKFTYIHRAQSSFLVEVDATGEVVITVVAASNGVFKLSHPQITYKWSGDLTVHPMPAGTVTLTNKGHFVYPGTDHASIALFLVCALPKEPVSVGDSFKVDLKMPDGITIKLDGKFASLGGPSNKLAKLVMQGRMIAGGENVADMTFVVTFDVKRGIYTSIVSTIGGGVSSSSLKLKEANQDKDEPEGRPATIEHSRA